MPAQSLGHLRASMGKGHLCFSEVGQAQLGCSGFCCLKMRDVSESIGDKGCGLPSRRFDAQVQLGLQRGS